MKIKYKIYKAFAFSILFLCILASCKEEDDGNLENMRTFRPGSVSVVSGETQAKISWSPSVFTEPGAVTYTVEISKDSLFGSVDLTQEVNTNELILTDQTIQIKQKYFARILASTGNESLNSAWTMSPSFQIRGEQILTLGAVKYTSAVITWRKGQVTHVVVTPEGGTGQRIDIAEEEKEAGSKVITELQQGKKYVVEIFRDNLIKGTLSITTPQLNLPVADRVIFLEPTDAINQTTFDTLTANNVVFVFLAGNVYANISPVVLKSNSTVSFIGEPLSPMPIYSADLITLPETGAKVRFENLDITGFKYENGEPTSAKRNYIFNQSAASQTEEITFENCIVRNFVNTPFRLQGSNPITVNKLVFNNCIGYDCGVNSTTGTYAFIHTNVATGKVDNIEVTNSTIYNIGYSIILHTSAPSQSVKIENCTFDDILGDGRYVVDYNAQTVGAFTLSNCVFGKTKSPAGTARGIRIAGLGVTATNSYKTTDFVATGGGLPAGEPFVIGGLSEYSKTSSDLFVSPATGDFNFKDETFTGMSTAGDPRWRK